jgi:hypothetical protein
MIFFIRNAIGVPDRGAPESDRAEGIFDAGVTSVPPAGKVRAGVLYHRCHSSRWPGVENPRGGMSRAAEGGEGTFLRTPVLSNHVMASQSVKKAVFGPSGLQGVPPIKNGFEDFGNFGTLTTA